MIYKPSSYQSRRFQRPVSLEDQRGLYKVSVDQKTHLILGATLYAAEAHETINLIALAMKAKLPYERLRDMIYTHPTMSEAFE